MDELLFVGDELLASTKCIFAQNQLLQNSSEGTQQSYWH